MLLEYETTKNIRESVREVDEKISAAKAEMKKLSLQEKVTKSMEIKRLQQKL